MKEEARSSVPRRMAMLVALAVVAVLSLGLLAACGSNGSGSSGGGYNIESLTMQVSITTVQGAEIGATHEFTYENTYTVDSLEAVVDSKTITYKDGDFK